VHVHSFTKGYGPDLRLGVIGGGLVQNAAAHLTGDPQVTQLVKEAREVYAQRRQQMIDALAGHGVHTPSIVAVLPGGRTPILSACPSR
jgi:hypothetical protein